jgi:hypothetical protein
VRRPLVADAVRVGESPVASVVLALLDQPVDVDVERPAARVGVEREGGKEVADECPGALPASAAPILLTHEVESTASARGVSKSSSSAASIAVRASSTRPPSPFAGVGALDDPVEPVERTGGPRERAVGEPHR